METYPEFEEFICHIYFKMEYLRMVRKWFQQGTMCVGLDLKDAFLHVPMSAQVRKFLRF